MPRTVSLQAASPCPLRAAIADFQQHVPPCFIGATSRVPGFDDPRVDLNLVHSPKRRTPGFKSILG